MTDPLSAVAGSIALGQGSASLVKGAIKVYNLKHAPDQISRLKQEVADVRALDQEAMTLVRSTANQLDIEIRSTILDASAKVQAQADELSDYIANELIRNRVSNEGGSCKVNKSKFLIAESKILKLKQEVLVARAQLEGALQLHAISVSSASSSQLLAKFESLREEVRQSMVGVAPQQHTTMVLDTSPSLNDDTDAVEEQTQSSRSTTPDEIDNDSYLRPELQRLTRRQSGCPPTCPCRCHSYTNLSSPGLLAPLFGQLNISYRATSWWHETCDQHWCRLKARHAAFKWVLPPWLVQRVLSGSYLHSSFTKPQYGLKLMNIRDDTWTLRQWLWLEDEAAVINEAQRQLSTKESSLLDVTSNGSTLLHLAILNNLWLLAFYLIEQGADAHFKDHLGCSPLMLGWGKHWQSPEALTEELTTKLSGDSTHFDEFGFPPLHKTYLGIKKFDITKLIEATPQDGIDVTDAQGKTVLSWAASRGDFPIMNLLIAHGASPDIARDDGCTPLHLSVQQRDHRCTRLLLKEAKANPNACNKSEISPLHFATAAEDVKMLLELGADPDKRDYKGRTPTQYAILEDEDVKLALLLDVEAICGLEDVNLAIQFDDVDCLRLLLTRWTELWPQHSVGVNTTFNCVACYASLATMDVLAELWLANLDWIDDEYQRTTVFGNARQRRDFNQEWSQTYAQPQDKSPSHWYNMFKQMFRRIVDRLGARDLHFDDEIEADEDWEHVGEAVEEAQL